jgi:DNA ligase-1
MFVMSNHSPWFDTLGTVAERVSHRSHTAVSMGTQAVGRRLIGQTRGVLFDELAAASETLAATARRNEKVATLSALLRRLDPTEIVPATSYLTGTTPSGRIGVGWATLSDVRVTAATEPSLDILDVGAAIDGLEAMSGAGVGAERRAALDRLLSRLTGREQQLIRGILGGELRQGALDGVMMTAVAAAADVSAGAVRRAVMMAGDLGAAAVAALSGGREALDAIHLEPLRPVQPMLASAAADVAEAIEATGLAQVDWKLDGTRVQAHRGGDVVRLFTRNLNDVTDRLPDVVEAVRAMPGGDLVLDGEAMGLAEDGSPRKFQDTMRRSTELQAFFFDVLFAEGAPVHDEPLSERTRLLTEIVPEGSRIPSIVTDDAAVAGSFLAAAIAAGHEGVMVKDLDQPYEAGRRGKGWRKVKPVYTLDLVVLAVEWGSGRRRGWLSNIHLGARDPLNPGAFVMIGKTFKGMTDEMLRWQTERFTELKTGEGPIGGRHAVHLRPEQVVEIALDGVQRSTTYPGGVALRFARVKHYRDDKSADAADTINTVRSLL